MFEAVRYYSVFTSSLSRKSPSGPDLAQPFILIGMLDTDVRKERSLFFPPLNTQGTVQTAHLHVFACRRQSSTFQWLQGGGRDRPQGPSRAIHSSFFIVKHYDEMLNPGHIFT